MATSPTKNARVSPGLWNTEDVDDGGGREGRAMGMKDTVKSTIAQVGPKVWLGTHERTCARKTSIVVIVARSTCVKHLFVESPRGFVSHLLFPPRSVELRHRVLHTPRHVDCTMMIREAPPPGAQPLLPSFLPSSSLRRFIFDINVCCEVLLFFTSYCCLN